MIFRVLGPLVAFGRTASTPALLALAVPVVASVAMIANAPALTPARIL